MNCKRCGSLATHPSEHDRRPGVYLGLCDVCYWGSRASSRSMYSAASYALVVAVLPACCDVCGEDTCLRLPIGDGNVALCSERCLGHRAAQTMLELRSARAETEELRALLVAKNDMVENLGKKLDAVRSLLVYNGCDCPCDCDCEGPRR